MVAPNDTLKGERLVDLTFEPVTKVQLYKEIAERIIAKINNSELKPGDKLPPERELAVLLGVSRTAIREALRSMEMMGFIQSRVGGGTFVRRVTVENILQPLSGVLSGDERLIAELMEVRYLLEGEIARLAALRASTTDVERMELALEAQKTAIISGDIGLESDTLFHENLAVAAKNLALEKITLLCRDLLTASRKAALENMDDVGDTIAHHQAMIHAIKSGDANLAEASMHFHLNEAYKNVTKARD